MGKGVAPTQLSKDRIVIVTGANTGIGYEIAKGVAAHGATVILACRSEERANRAIASMKEEFEANRRSGKSTMTNSLCLEFMKLDLCSLQSVVDFADTFKKSGRKLHVLFCNAGLGMQPFDKTEDGFEKTLQVNYLGHFILVAKLLPIMRQSGPDCRILMTSSLMHKKYDYDINKVHYTGPPRDFPGLDYYGKSKLYQIMQMHCMVRRLEGSHITITCFCPGPTSSDFGQGVELQGCLTNCMFCCVKTFGRSPNTVARYPIDWAANPKYNGVTGMYYESGKRTDPSPAARSEKNQEEMWKKSFEMAGKYITDDEKAVMEGTSK